MKGIYADVDNGDNTLNKKIRNGEVAQYNFILGTPHFFFRCYVHVRLIHLRILLFLVVGQDELDTRSVNVRNRDDVGTKARSAIVKLDTIVDQLLSLKASRSLHNKLE